MKKIIVATKKPFAKEAVDRIKKLTENANFEFVLIEKYTEKSQLLEAVKEANAIIIRSDIIDKEVIAAAKNLEIVVRAGAGYDNVDLQSASDNNIVVMNTPGQNSNAVAELVFGMMVYSARNLFNGKPGTELKNKNLGILAYGNVGRNVARIAKGFNMNVYAFDAFVKAEQIENEGIKSVKDTAELFKTCQYVSLHIPGNAQTNKSINFELMNSMPKNAVLVNTARKEIINEEDLLKIMEQRPDFRYVSDITPDCEQVFKEKFAGRYFFSPKKMGAQTQEANVNAGVAAINQILDFFKTGNTKFKVN